jgi:creatinine amidohydrolase
MTGSSYRSARPSNTHDWWRAPQTWTVVRGLDPTCTHVSWMENFPWTRLAGVVMPSEPKEEDPDLPTDPAAVRAALGGGSYGGPYERADEDMLRVWATGVAETRERIESL